MEGDSRNELDITTPIVGKQHIVLLEGETHTGNESGRKQHFLYHKEKHRNNKEAYTDGSKSTGKKVDFEAVFVNITRRGMLPEEASIHTAEMTSIKTSARETQKRENEIWVIYTDSLSFKLVIENNRENHPILNQIYRHTSRTP